MKLTRLLSLLALALALASLALSFYTRQLWTRLEPFNSAESEAFRRGRWMGAKEAVREMRGTNSAKIYEVD